MTHVPLTAVEHRQLARQVSRNLHLVRDHLDEVAGIPGDYSDPHCALFARIHDDLQHMQQMLEALKAAGLLALRP
jgi:hypothetical protein